MISAQLPYAYTKWVGKRLPTEKEWEFAPQGTTEWESKVKQFYRQIESVIPKDLAPKVIIDSIQDVTRIMKLIGTTSIKANPTKDRPNRVSSWIDSPEEIETDHAFLDYVQSLEPNNLDFSLNAAPTIDPQFLPSKIEGQQFAEFNRAMNSFHVQAVRQNNDGEDLSAADYALIRELAKEGILDPNVLHHALIITEGSKYQRNGQLSYVYQTVNKFHDHIVGLPLPEARKELERQFEAININQNGLILCQAPIATGKSYCARKLVVRAIQDGQKVLVIVPTHLVAQEWKRNLEQEIDSASIVRLYGLNHAEVECPFQQQQQAQQLIANKSLDQFRQQYCQSCFKQDKCPYFQGYNKAKEADILIAQHAHANNYHGFFQKISNDNRDRQLVVIDEMPKLVHETVIKPQMIKDNLQALKAIQKNTQHQEPCQIAIDIL